jgi:hypothetical protein
VITAPASLLVLFSGDQRLGILTMDINDISTLGFNGKKTNDFDMLTGTHTTWSNSAGTGSW